MNKKSLNLMICALLSLVFIVSPVVVKADPAKVKQAEEDINKAKAENEGIDKNLKEKAEQIMKIDNNISNLTVDIGENESKIDELNKEVIDKQKLVDKAQDDTKNAREAFRERAEEIYKHGNNNYFEGIIKSRDIEDFIQRLSYVKKAIDTDKELVDNCEKSEKEYKEKMYDLQNVLKEQEDLKVANNLKLTELNLFKDEQKKNIKELEEKQKENKNWISESQLVIDLGKYNIEYTPQRGVDSSTDPVTMALKYVNKTPYVWGGNTPDGFDCSGLVVYCFKNASDVYLPRTSEMQQTVGTPVANEDMQRGDLVFYGYPAHHVGIYIGDGLMVHAPYTGRMISVEPVLVYNDYSGARRMK